MYAPGAAKICPMCKYVRVRHLIPALNGYTSDIDLRSTVSILHATATPAVQVSRSTALTDTPPSVPTSQHDQPGTTEPNQLRSTSFLAGCRLAMKKLGTPGGPVTVILTVMDVRSRLSANSPGVDDDRSLGMPVFDDDGNVMKRVLGMNLEQDED